MIWGNLGVANGKIETLRVSARPRVSHFLNCETEKLSFLNIAKKIETPRPQIGCETLEIRLKFCETHSPPLNLFAPIKVYFKTFFVEHLYWLFEGVPPFFLRSEMNTRRTEWLCDWNHPGCARCPMRCKSSIIDDTCIFHYEKKLLRDTLKK